VSRSEILPHVRRILFSDPVWCAYALADTYPPYQAHAAWFFERDSLLLRYNGLQPPILFAHGDPVLIRQLFEGIPGGIYQYSLMGVHFDGLKARLRPRTKQRMWRMRLHESNFPGAQATPEVTRLGSGDLNQVLELFGEHADRPDAFHEDQLSHGIYYGFREGTRLLCVAGTHVISADAGVAAIGNVFTHPEHRGEGLARRTTAAVVGELIAQGIRTIVLNVSMQNEPALRCYAHLGFRPYCGYYEGVTEVIPSSA
jgi:ribosomal protein S18 acetylase RimI-like enzyme